MITIRRTQLRVSFKKTRRRAEKEVGSVTGVLMSPNFTYLDSVDTKMDKAQIKDVRMESEAMMTIPRSQRSRRAKLKKLK